MQNPAYLAPKPRYEILDGLRGVAAMLVVAYHLFETYSPGPVYQILNHGYLAVDFFFVLSGFVIGYAYDDRWGKMTLKDFFKRRLVRLHPMVIMGTLIGTLLFYFAECPVFPMISQTAWWKLILLCLLGCTMLPALVSWDIRGWGETNSLNGPTWSLMWEYIANILYALFVRHFSKTFLALFVMGAAFLTIDLTMNLDVFNLFSANRHAPFTVIGGWSITPDQMYIGITRLLYPFFAGLLLSRINKLIKVKGAFWWCSALVAVMMAMPRIGGEENMWMNGAYEAFCILFMFPLVVSMGAGNNVTGKKSVAICAFLGRISYPLYVTHYPLIYMYVAWASAHPDAPLGTVVCLGVSIFILAIGLAYACLKLYDEPARDWLKRHWLMRSKS